MIVPMVMLVFMAVLIMMRMIVTVAVMGVGLVGQAFLLHGSIENNKVTSRSSMALNSPDLPRWRIGEAARRSGIAAANIRYYEKEQLLSEGVREDNQYRLYTDGDVHRLRFIRLCRAMDMSLDEVRTLLALDGARKADCVAARDTLDTHLGHVRERLAELQALEHELEHLRGQCDGTDSYCHIIEALHAQADEPLPQTLQGGAATKRHV